MKKILMQSCLALLCLFTACDKRENWAEGTLSPVISIEDLRLLYKGSDLTLNTEKLAGAHQISGIVISDANAGNSQVGMLVVQNTSRKKTRGINVNIGNAASSFKPGDSVVITIDGAVLKTQQGALHIDGISINQVTLVSQNNAINAQLISISQLKSNPYSYESTLVNIYTGDFVPAPTTGETFNGDKTYTDGTAEIILHTEVSATFAGRLLPTTASITAVAHVYQTTSTTEPQISLWPRNTSDIKEKLILQAWNLVGSLGNEVALNSNVVNANMETAILSRGSGITAASAGASYASTFPINVDKAAAIAADAYYQITLKPKGNAKVSLSTLDVILRIQTNAPKTYIWRYSMDGGSSFKDIAEPYTWTTGFSENNGIQQPQIDLSDIEDFKNLTASTPIVFRLYAWGGTSITSNNGFRIGKSLTTAQHALTIGGTVIQENI